MSTVKHVETKRVIEAVKKLNESKLVVTKGADGVETPVAIKFVGIAGDVVRKSFMEAVEGVDPSHDETIETLFPIVAEVYRELTTEIEDALEAVQKPPKEKAEKPTKEKKEPKEKVVKEKKEVAPKYSRVTALCEALKETRATGGLVTELIQTASDKYVLQGGTDKLVEAAFFTKVGLTVLSELGFAIVADGKYEIKG